MINPVKNNLQRANIILINQKGKKYTCISKVKVDLFRKGREANMEGKRIDRHKSIPEIIIASTG